MVKATHDRQPADAAASARDMHEGVVQGAIADDDVSKPQKSPASLATTPIPEITRRNVRTASSTDAPRRFPKPTPKDSNLALQAGLNRSKGKTVASSSKDPSTTSSKPVLVRKPSSKTEMRKKPTTRIVTSSPKLPPLESFSFQDILASIGPDADDSIDAIAEICGRSKMSLAEEHGSHLPPQGTVTIARESSPAESVPPLRLETVDETRSRGPQTRSKSRSLALAGAVDARNSVMADATAVMSNITSHIHTSNEGQRDSMMSSSSGHGYLLPQILAWLRRPNADSARDNSQADGAARALHSLLNETASIHSFS